MTVFRSKSSAISINSRPEARIRMAIPPWPMWIWMASSMWWSVPNAATIKWAYMPGIRTDCCSFSLIPMGASAAAAWLVSPISTTTARLVLPRICRRSSFATPTTSIALTFRLQRPIPPRPIGGAWIPKTTPALPAHRSMTSMATGSSNWYIATRTISGSFMAGRRLSPPAWITSGTGLKQPAAPLRQTNTLW